MKINKEYILVGVIFVTFVIIVLWLETNYDVPISKEWKSNVDKRLERLEQRVDNHEEFIYEFGGDIHDIAESLK